MGTLEGAAERLLGVVADAAGDGPDAEGRGGEEVLGHVETQHLGQHDRRQAGEDLRVGVTAFGRLEHQVRLDSTHAFAAPIGRTTKIGGSAASAGSNSGSSTSRYPQMTSVRSPPRQTSCSPVRHTADPISIGDEGTSHADGSANVGTAL